MPEGKVKPACRSYLSVTSFASSRIQQTHQSSHLLCLGSCLVSYALVSRLVFISAFPYCKHLTLLPPPLPSSLVPPTPCRLFRARQPTLRMRVIARKVLYATHLCTFICICLALKFYEVESNSNKNNERGKKEKQTLSKFHGYLNVLPFPASVRRPLPAPHSR